MTQYTGTDGLTYDYDSTTKALVISGSGNMSALSYGRLYVSGGGRQYFTDVEAATINSGITSIGDDAFKECTSLTSVTIGNSVTSIGGEAFYQCASLTSVTIGDGVTSIGYSAFYRCTSLTSVMIPDSVTYIGAMAFSGCTSLTEISVSSGNVNYSSENGILFNKTKTEIIQYPAGKTESSYVVPNSITSIGHSAFLGCTTLTSVTIPNSVESIDIQAFYGCTSLTSVTIPNSVTSIRGSAFYKCTSLTSVTIPDSVTSLAGSAFWECTSLTKAYYMSSTPTQYSGMYNITPYMYVPYNSVSAYRTAWSSESARIFFASLDEATISVAQQTYDGAAKTPAVVTARGVTLTLNTDYTASYSNNINAGEASVSVSGTGTCRGSKSATFTIAKATITGVTTSYNPTYNGSMQLPANSDLIYAGVAVRPADANVTIAAKPTYDCTNAGNHIVTVAVNDDNYNTFSTDVTYAIAKKALADSMVAISGSYTYNGSEQTAIVIVSDGSPSIITAADYDISGNTGTNAGTYTVTVGSTASGNYVGEATKTWVIEKAASTATAPTAKTGLIYTGLAMELIDLGSSSTGTIKYKLSTETDYYLTSPMATNAATHTVDYKVFGDSNHNDLTGYVTVSIAKANNEISGVYANELEFDNTDQQLVTAGTATFGTVEYKVGTGSYGIAIPTGKNAADYLVSYYVPGTSNYYEVTGSVNVTIAKRSISNVTISTTNLTYNGSIQTTEVTVTDGSPSIISASDYTVSGQTQMNAGSYIVTITATDAGNYSGTASAPWSIAKKALTDSMVSISGTYTYNGSVQTVSYSVSDGSPSIISASDYAVSGQTYTNAGDYILIVAATDAGNYSGSVSASWSINKVQLTVSGTTTSNKTYDGNTSSVTTLGTVIGIIGSEDVIIAVVGTFSDANAADSKVVTLVYSMTGADVSNYMKPVNGSTNANISKKALSNSMLSVSPISFKYDSQSHSPTVTVSDGSPSIITSADWEYDPESENTGTSHGRYDIIINATAAGNYSGSASCQWSILTVFKIDAINSISSPISGSYVPTQSSFNITFTPNEGYILTPPIVNIGGSGYTGYTFTNGILSIPTNDLIDDVTVKEIAVDDAFCVHMSYDHMARILSTTETNPIIGTEGDENSTRVEVRGLSSIYSDDTATTYHECWIMFDIAEIVKNVVLTNKIKLVHLSGDVWYCDISANVFNNTIKGKLPVQIMITKVQETNGEKMLLQKYYSFNQINFKVAPAIKAVGTC